MNHGEMGYGQPPLDFFYDDPPSPFGYNEEISIAAGTPAVIIPNNGFGMLPWGIEGVVFVFMALIAFSFIVFAILFVGIGIAGQFNKFRRNLFLTDDGFEFDYFYDYSEYEAKNGTDSPRTISKITNALNKYDDFED